MAATICHAEGSVNGIAFRNIAGAKMLVSGFPHTNLLRIRRPTQFGVSSRDTLTDRT